MTDFIIKEDNTKAFKDASDIAIKRALEIICGKAESYAKALVAPLGPKGNPMRTAITAQLRNSIHHKVEDHTALIYSNLDMAAYVELGTGNKYEPSAEWIKTNVEKGKNSGLSKWFFYDKELGRVRIGLPMAPTPFLRPAVENHKDEYKNVVENELKNG